MDKCGRELDDVKVKANEKENKTKQDGQVKEERQLNGGAGRRRRRTEMNNKREEDK